MNETHDPGLISWVKSANKPATDFPIQNLPFGVFRERDRPPTVGIAIGDSVVDIGRCLDLHLLEGREHEAALACRAPSLNAFMALGQKHQALLRGRLSRLLRHDAPEFRKDPSLETSILHPVNQVDLLLPVEIGDYTDFYASQFHAMRIGSMFRPSHPLLPNYKYVPVGYHGRSSSIIVSSTPVRRPRGQVIEKDEMPPEVKASGFLDYEIEVGFFIGQGTDLGEPLSIKEAGDHLFGLCLVNDWSARDIQKWEYQPLGPFLGKNFATTVSPWIVTMEALEPFRTGASRRSADDPPPLDYLVSHEDQQSGGVDMTLEVSLHTATMRERSIPPQRLSVGNFSEMYWTIAQMLTHHSSNGCNLRTGDLLASGTVSGKADETRGCLQEITLLGRNPLTLSDGEIRASLEDGDEVIMRGWCEREGFRRIGFGECRGVIISPGAPGSGK